MKRFASLAVLLGSAAVLPADPCGMVPPFQLNPGNPELVRVGDQLTYVFFKEGVEDIALRPGFEGELNDFGMLIPFPAIPEIRKVSDHIFTHIRQAIDPPEVVIDMRVFPDEEMVLDSVAEAVAGEVDPAALQVKVLKEEAVGMYQVAVLEAENPRALAAWMKLNGYIYPDGMDDVCREYIEGKWCFVAVKANIGSQSQVEPKPGMRKADANADGGFTGAVQAMGFRFRVEEPIVPMRLSAFNEGPLHNIVYYFSDESAMIEQLSETMVAGQISGSQLYRNMTEPLPVKVLGGTLAEAEKQGYLKMPEFNRDPEPKNGDALDLFASDLLSVRNGALSHPFEEREKELLKIGERLGLRGEEIDRGIQGAIEKEREEAQRLVATDFDNMTLTVIGGDFPRKIIADQNLTFKVLKAPKLEVERYKELLTGAHSQGDGAGVVEASLVSVGLIGFFSVSVALCLGRFSKD